MGKIIIEQIPMPQMENLKRKIRVVLPENYDRNLSERYPVLYMHDGQNMTDPSPWSGYSWNVERIVSALENEGRIPGIIVVGIDTDDISRLSEYSQAIDKKAEKRVRKLCHGNLFVPGAFSYSSFIIETLKPFIDQKYRTLSDREHTGTFGSSCGGNISIFLGTLHNDVFGIIGAFSPAYWLVKEDLFQRVEAKHLDPHTWIYHDMGLKEAWHARWTYARDDRQFHGLIVDKGFDDRHLKQVVDKEGRHTELFWQSRLPDFLSFAFGKK
jgi:predicted alpha/beta superfamily hydrolase